MDINAGDTAWLLASSALVLLMTPGLAFFYSRLTRAKSALNMMMMMSFVTVGIVSILWGHLSWDGLATAATTTFGAQGDRCRRGECPFDR